MERITFDLYRRDEEILKEVLSSVNIKKNCIYGCGDIGLLVQDCLEKNGIQPDFFVVDDEYFSLPLYQGLPILKLSDLSNMTGELNIFIGFANIAKALENLSEIRNRYQIYCLANPCEYLKQYDINALFFQEHEEEFVESLHMMEDDLSKKIFIAYLNTRINLNYEYMLQHTGGG